MLLRTIRPLFDTWHKITAGYLEYTTAARLAALTYVRAAYGEDLTYAITYTVDWRIDSLLPRISKRITRKIKDHGFDPKLIDVAAMGAAIAAAQPENLSLHLRIVDQADWNPGDWCEYTRSCWWGDYENGRLIFNDSPRCFAVQISDGIAAAGRFFAYSDPKSDFLSIFNLYTSSSFFGVSPTLKMAAHWLQIALRDNGIDLQVSAHDHGIRHDQMYVNGESAAVLYSGECPDHGRSVTIYSGIDESQYRGESCDRCGDRCEDTYNVDGESWCESCANYYANYCDHCSEYTAQDTYNVDGESWCESCAERDACQCDHCSDYTENPVTVDGRDWCESCAYDRASQCDHCGDYSESPERVHNGETLESWCADCAESHAQNCVKCDRSIGDHVIVNGDIWCEDCAYTGVPLDAKIQHSPTRAVSAARRESDELSNYSRFPVDPGYPNWYAKWL